MTDNFWQGGAEAYAKGLKVEYRARLTELKTELAERFDPSRRALVEEQIAKLKADYRAKCRRVGNNIH